MSRLHVEKYHIVVYISTGASYIGKIVVPRFHIDIKDNFFFLFL